jgi:DNA-binding beta-propeller fold protein YncE
MTPHPRTVSCLAALLAALLPALGFAAPSFVEFESGQVRPLALSPNGLRLFAVNTPDGQLEIFDVDAGGLTHAGSVPVGMEPVAVAARNDGEVWVVNHLSDSVSIVDVASVPPRVTRTLLVGDEPRDIVFAGPGGNRAFITTAHRGQNRPGDPQFITAGVGRADVWVFDAAALATDGTLGGTPMGGAPIVLFGDTPRALAVSPAGDRVYAAVFHSGNQTASINEASVCDGGSTAGTCNVSGTVMPGGLPAPNTNFLGVAGPETGLIVKFNIATGRWEDRLGRNWSPGIRFSLPDHDVFAIDANAAVPVEIPSAVVDHVGTVLFNMAVNPASGRVYVSNTDARNETRFEGPGTFAKTVAGAPSPTTVRGHLHEARISVLDGTTATARHLNKHIDYNVVPSPAGTSDDSLATPLGMAVTADGSRLYVAAFGSSKVGVFNTTLLENDMFVPSALDHIVVSGGGPSGLVLDEPRGRLYVFTRFDDSVSVIDTAMADEIAHLPVHNPEPASIRDGRPVLYDARATSSNGETACASCHIFGDFDSLAWDLGNPDDRVLNNPNPFRLGPFGDPDFHPLKGPMTTQSLRGMANHGPMHWRGDRTGGNDVGGSALDENAAFLKFIVAFDGLLGRGAPISSTDMQKFADFILQVTYPPNPVRALDNSLNADQTAGRNFFMNTISDVVETCNGCHVLNPAAGFFGSDGFSTFENETQHFKIAHLRNLYQKIGMFGMPAIPFINAGNNANQGPQVRGFGFLHDGSVDTIFRFHNATVFTGFAAGATGTTQRRQMEQFMLAFDSNLAPMVGQQVTLTSSNGAAVGTRISLMLARAALNECDVIVKGTMVVSPTVREQRGWVRTAAGTFQSDRTGEPLLTDAQLRAQAGTALQERTYTCVPPGSGVRAGIDRDEDTFPDRTELDAGTDPADALSFPGGGSTTTTSTTSTTSTTGTTPTTLPGRSKCTSKKLTLAGNKVSGRAKCQGKAVGNGVGVDSACLQKASNKFSAGWAKAEHTPNDCRTLGDEGAIESLADAGVVQLVALLAPSSGPSRCASKKFSAAGKRASVEAKCHAKAIAKGLTVDAGCLQKAATKFGTAWAKAESAGDCLTLGDQTTVANAVDSIVAGFISTLNP